MIALAPATFPPVAPDQHRALGVIQGLYLPSQDRLGHGSLLCDDGLLEAFLIGEALRKGATNKIDLSAQHTWSAYPRTAKDGKLILFLVRTRLAATEDLNKFLITGILSKVEGDRVKMLIKYEADGKMATIPLILSGEIPQGLQGRLISAECERQKDKLVLQHWSAIKQTK